ncbi:MAG: 2-C-methyl-D-erythritol 2,4-cyclodiphosphate synthase [Candidatus Zixiibacteriota bacterium]|nr:MAG: 2-C-methyl-D-erythritol 2,4-cyclodiphosphate synthase [candidate division Zixibacteria bacterium]
MRIGSGFDVHQLVEGRPLMLGGVEIPFSKGLLGHSDADVLIHAICDALFGAANLGDIGQHFPDTDQKFKDIDSKLLLYETLLLITKKGYTIGNIDCTICAQKPKLADYIPQMKTVLAEVLKIPVEDISIKATTTEELGFVGREEGICAMATVLVVKK